MENSDNDEKEETSMHKPEIKWTDKENKQNSSNIWR
jgi:hypothetical protein